MITSRRDFIKGSTLAGAAVALPSWTPRLAFRQHGRPARGDIIVSIFQRGGMDSLSAVVPYQERGYFDSRPRIAYREPRAGDKTAVVDLDGQFGLSPALVSLRKAWDDGVLAVVHAVGSPQPTRSHFDAMDIMERGSSGLGGAATGWLGRHLEVTARDTDSPFRAIGFGSVIQQSLRSSFPAASLQSIADFHLQGRSAELNRFRAHLEHLYWSSYGTDDSARSAFAALDLLEQADPLSYGPEHGAQYPDTMFGQGLKQIAQLIKADVGLEVACLDIGGWDTHTSQVWGNSSDPTFGQMHNLLTQLDQALGAFVADLGTRLVDPGVTIVTMSELGRRVAQNAANGTDHGRGGAMFVLGGGVVRGVHTTWPGLEPTELVDGDLDTTTDYRDVLGEILTKRLGNPGLDRVFPGYKPSFRGVVNARADAPAPVRPQAYLPSLRNR